MNKTLLFLFLFLEITLTTYAQNANLEKQIDFLISAKTEKPFNGVIFISQKGKTKYFKTLGYSDLNKKIPLQLNDEFVIGSISKQFTAILVLQEYDKGRLELFVPIHKYLPELQQTWADTVTIHQLLTHTHGIVELDKPTTFKPGTQYAYSQIGYDLLAKIIERTSGESFADLSQKMFTKCKMKNTFHPDIREYKNLVKGYTEVENGKIEFENKSLQNYPAAGGFISNCIDLNLWNDQFYGGKLLKKETMKMLETKQKNAVRNHPIFGMTDYGYGITIDTIDGVLQYGQTGYGPGFVTMNYYYPKTKTTVIVLENVDYYPNIIKKTFYYHTEILKIIRDKLKG
ncbi:serine hydrolase domain-containing protein [Flavobacterium pectinovorum]|uniref:Class A beta-lactamase-related serine hydrolase n=1 Tax=Flavobacterium pectinovorum TaxID=29533 RepID=A0A502EYH8_9FLAO|nr:serine hydrolase domain-containing protein [Flavobacterium pectinovorum]TPG41640.1 class A beta-lactamase-related serine hydrolase [Flavobacterium pectinovorum]